MKRVALYPFNKITQGLIRFRDLLDFEIVSVIDFVFQSGEDTGEIIDGTTANICIHNSMSQGLEDIDTLILNDPGTYFGGNKEVFEEHDLLSLWRDIVLDASSKGIQVVSVHEIYDKDTICWMNANHVEIKVFHGFSDSLLSEVDNKYDTSGTMIDNYLKQFENEYTMFARTKKIKRIGIFATRGCIGKFTTQLGLYREFKKSGIKVTALITEPTGYLFNQPEGDIFKFLAHRPLDKYPYYIDTIMNRAEQDGFEWIIMAGQSSILPTSNIAFNSLRFAMLKAFDPDYNLLIVGYSDDEQIHDALELLRIFSKRPIVLLLPDKVEVSYGEYVNFTYEQRMSRKQELQDKFDINVEFIEHVSKIKENIIEVDTLVFDKSEYAGF
ncbi:putative NAD-dependent epimerase/dehydratase family protein [Paenibacillus sp. DS2015]|uniref:DUF1611 domain-containing protein n=1 Tax=Paenibacillus sp. DS2015 TaxID=3373917 RepID=UPI003D227228